MEVQTVENAERRLDWMVNQNENQPVTAVELNNSMLSNGLPFSASADLKSLEGRGLVRRIEDRSVDHGNLGNVYSELGPEVRPLFPDCARNSEGPRRSPPVPTFVATEAGRLSEERITSKIFPVSVPSTRIFNRYLSIANS